MIGSVLMEENKVKSHKIIYTSTPKPATSLPELTLKTCLPLYRKAPTLGCSHSVVPIAEYRKHPQSPHAEPELQKPRPFHPVAHDAAVEKYERDLCERIRGDFQEMVLSLNIRVRKGAGSACPAFCVRKEEIRKHTEKETHRKDNQKTINLIPKSTESGKVRDSGGRLFTFSPVVTFGNMVMSKT